MKIKTSYILYGAIALIIISQGDRVGEAVDRNDRIRSEQANFADLVRTNRASIRQAEKLSQIALDRYRNNCALVVDATNGEEALFQPGEPVIDPRQQNRTLRSGLLICNRLGDTAVISQNGTITDIARVATPDLQEFKQLLGSR